MQSKRRYGDKASAAKNSSELRAHDFVNFGSGASRPRRLIFMLLDRDVSRFAGLADLEAGREMSPTEAKERLGLFLVYCAKNGPRFSIPNRRFE